MKNIAIIPARGGSKAIPRKNIKKLCGKTLIGYIIETALHVKKLDRVIVSTEDSEIAEIARKYGAEIPFVRPKSLAGDETPTLPVLQHAVNYLEKKEKYQPNVVVLLYATFPFLQPQTISKAIAMMDEGRFDSVVSIVKDTGHYWIKKKKTFIRLYPKIVQNRQLVKPLLKENGAIYSCTRDLLMEKGKLVGGTIGFLEMSRKESVDIDEPLDFEYAEFLMRKKN